MRGQIIECVAEEDLFDGRDTQTLKDLRLVSRFASDCASRILFEELDLTNCSVEKVSEIYSAFCNERLRCIPRRITNHLYNMVPQNVLLLVELLEISDKYPTQYEAEARVLIDDSWQEWIVPYFNLVKQLYASLGPQIQTIGFHATSNKPCRGRELVESVCHHLSLWYLWIHFTCIGSLRSHINIHHIQLCDVPYYYFEGIGRRHRFYEEEYQDFSGLKEMIEQDNIETWLTTKIHCLTISFSKGKYLTSHFFSSLAHFSP